MTHIKQINATNRVFEIEFFGGTYIPTSVRDFKKLLNGVKVLFMFWFGFDIMCMQHMAVIFCFLTLHKHSCSYLSTVAYRDIPIDKHNCEKCSHVIVLQKKENIK